mmetsp:Transcript_16364/g.18880  ORF Transcript_16364/g.18880 Transcript_16364/m.18880 type:complete len:112 (+) Transcript_16364:190-525(+)
MFLFLFQLPHRFDFNDSDSTPSSDGGPFAPTANRWIVRRVDEPPAVHHNATGIVPNKWSWARRAHEVLRQKLSNGITFSAVRYRTYNTRIKSNPCVQCNQPNKFDAVLISE